MPNIPAALLLSLRDIQHVIGVFGEVKAEQVFLLTGAQSVVVERMELVRFRHIATRTRFVSRVHLNETNQHVSQEVCHCTPYRIEDAF